MAAKSKRADLRNVSEVEYFVSLKELENKYKNGHDLALDICVMRCYDEEIVLPEWAVIGLVERSQANIIADAQQAHRFKSLYTAVMMAIDEYDGDGIIKDNARYGIAEALFSISNFRTHQGKSITAGNIEKRWREILKDEQADRVIVHADAYHTFLERLNRLRENISTEKMEVLIAQMEEINLPY